MNYIGFPNLGLQFNIDPVAFRIGEWQVYWYGIIMAVAIIGASVFALFRAKRRDMDGDFVVDCIICAVVGAIIGARLYYVAFYGNWGEILAIWNGGLAIYGGVIGGIVALILKLTIDNSQLTIKKSERKASFWEVADLFAPCLILGQAIGRWGNFVNREAFGSGTEGFLRMCIWENGDLVSVHPTFLYESLWCLVGLVMILLLEKKGEHSSPLRSGVIMWVYVAWYGLGRVFIEGLRTDSLMFFGVRISQVLAGVSLILALVMIYKKLRVKS